MYSTIMRKYVKNPVRSFRVEESHTNKVRFFDNISGNSGGLEGFSDTVHVAYQLPTIKKVNLTWFSDPDPFYIGSNDELFEMWDKGVVEDDGYIHLYMNVTNRRVPLSDECPSSSCLSVSKSLFSTPGKVQSTSRIHIERGAAPVSIDPSLFLTPKKRNIYSKSPELLRRSPRLVQKSIAAFNSSVNSKKLFVNVDDDDNGVEEISVASRQAELEYENIQLTNTEEDMCHPIDDCRSPVADDVEMGIEVYTEFVNNYFGGLDSFDYLHPQLYKEKGNADEAQNYKSGGVGEECDPKGKEIYIIPSDTDSGDSSSKCDSEDEYGTLSVQGVVENEGQKIVWVSQYEKVWGPHVEAAERTCGFDDDTGDAEEFLDVGTMFVGMEFMDKKDFKKHLRAYAVKKKFQYKLRPNDNERIKVNCKYNKSQGCKFFIYASVRTGEPTFILRKMNLEHTCVTEGVTINSTANAEYVAQFLYDKMKNGDPMPSPFNLQDQFHTTHNTSVPYHVAWRARTLTLERVNGSYDDSYRLVPAFSDMVDKTNPGSLTNYTFGSIDGCFESMTIAFAAPLKGFHEGCRNVIGFDDCHLTGKHGGCLMAATALDAKNRVVPLAIMVTRNEIGENWHLFMKALKPYIINHPRGKMTFI